VSIGTFLLYADGDRAWPSIASAFRHELQLEVTILLAIRYANLFLVGRHGMHRYNNQDHSMLTVAGHTG
jgi:hypothetical protein